MSNLMYLSWKNDKLKTMGLGKHSKSLAPSDSAVFLLRRNKCVISALVSKIYIYMQTKT